MPNPILTTFPVGTPLERLAEALNVAGEGDVRTRLEEVGLPAAAIERSGDQWILRRPVTVDPAAAQILAVDPASPYRPTPDAPNVTGATGRRVTERGIADRARREGLARFVDRTAQQAVAVKLDQTLRVAPGARLQVE